MATQIRRTFRRAARFLRAPGKAFVVAACGGLVLWSAVAAQAEMSWLGLTLNGLGPNGMPFNGMPRNGIPTQGMPIQGMPYNGTPLQGLPAQEGSLPTVPRERLPWSTLSHQAIGEVPAPAMQASRDSLLVGL